MGRMKEYYMELQETAFERSLSQALGISYEEFTELDYDIFEENYDGITIKYNIQINLDNSPRHITSKITGLNELGFINVESWELLDDNDNNSEEFQTIVEEEVPLLKFIEELENIKVLSKIEISDGKIKKLLNRQIFISVIGIMETYLSDTFINRTMNNVVFYENFVGTNKKIKEQKFELSQILNEYKKLNETVEKIMREVIYHNLPTVREMYRATFNIKFPNLDEIMPYISIRHHLVHRNGKNMKGEAVEPDENDINLLIDKVSQFIGAISLELDVSDIS